MASAVEPLFDLSSPAGGPPSDHFTALRNNTLLRVNLPKPDCTVRLSDCLDLDVINTLDGFNNPAAAVHSVLRRHRPQHGDQQHGVPGAPR